MKIDWWTLGLQTVNVVILIWLLEWFFWEPIAAMIAQRRASTSQILADAEAKRTAATAALGEIELTRAGFAKERGAILEAAREAAEQEHASRLKRAETEVAALEATAKDQIDKDRAAAEKAWVDRASRLAVEIAARLLGRLNSHALRTGFLDWLVKEIKNLPDAARQTMAANGAALEAISAAPLEPAEQEHCRTAVSEALQARPQISFKVDPGLIAGLELRGSHLVVSNSWRADLDRILLELAHDDRR